MNRGPAPSVNRLAVSATTHCLIGIMEAIDNLAMVLVAGAMAAALGDALFWGTLLGGFAVAYPVAVLANRYLISRGKGHARMHEQHR